MSNINYLNSYLLINGILYKKWNILSRNKIDSNTTISNIVLPSLLLNKDITNITNMDFRNYTDLKHMLFKFKLKYYHPQERSMIHKYVRNCDVC